MTYLAFITVEAVYGNVKNDVPATPEDAICGADKLEWVTSMADETNSLVENGVFEVVEMPKARKIGICALEEFCRWYYPSQIARGGEVIFSNPWG